MKFLQYLNEWSVKFEYAGRGISNKNPIIWMYITKPQAGLIWSDYNGEVYLNSKKIYKIKNYSNIMTHKYILGVVYNLIDKLHLTTNLRNDVDTIVDMDSDVNVRGRISGSDIYIYSSGMMGAEEKTYKRICDKAVDSIYDYIPEKT